MKKLITILLVTLVTLMPALCFAWPWSSGDSTNISGKANLTGGNTFTDSQIFQGITVDSLSLSADAYGLTKPVNWYVAPSYVFPPRAYVTSPANYLSYYGSIYYMAGTGYQDIYSITGVKTWTIDNDYYWSEKSLGAFTDAANFTSYNTPSLTVVEKNGVNVLSHAGGTAAVTFYILKFLNTTYDLSPGHGKWGYITAVLKFCPVTEINAAGISVGLAITQGTATVPKRYFIGSVTASDGGSGFKHSTNFKIKVKDSNLRTYTTSTPIVPDTYYVLEIRVKDNDGVAPNLSFRVNGIQAADETVTVDEGGNFGLTDYGAWGTNPSAGITWLPEDAGSTCPVYIKFLNQFKDN